MVTFVITVLFCIFIGEIGGGNCPLNGSTLCPSHLLSNVSLNNVIMGNRIEYQKGQKVGECIFINDIISKKGENRKAIFECKCGNQFTTQISHVKNMVAQSCGCRQKELSKQRMTTHGLNNHPLYNTWKSMKQRCCNIKHVLYKYYGARGINVCDEWCNDFMSFYDHVITLPNCGKFGMTLDREKNNQGYKPGNVRWVDRRIQTINRNIQSNNKSGFIGISFNKPIKKWTSHIGINKKSIHLGVYVNPRDGAIARDQYILDNNLFEYKLQILTR